MIATCIDCGADFERETTETWKKRCLDCWKLSKAGHKTDDPEAAAKWYRKGFEAGRATAMAENRDGGATLDVERLRELLQLVHPDRHGGSALAVRVTQWLLELRRKVAA